MSEQVLEHEAADARAGVERRQDEERLEHDREVVPESERRCRRAPARRCCAMPTARLGAPPVRAKSVCSPIWSARCAICSGVTGKPQALIVAVAATGSAPTTPGRAVDREVHARIERGGGDHRHDRDERLEEHRSRSRSCGASVSSREQLRRGAGRDQRVEAGDRAARDGDEAEREHLAGEDRTGAVDEAGERRQARSPAAAPGCRPRARRSCRASRTSRGSRAARAAATPAAPRRRSRRR